MYFLGINESSGVFDKILGISFSTHYFNRLILMF